MRNYQLSYLIQPDLTEEELKKVEEKISLLIQKEGGILIEKDPAIKKNLAYPIKKRRLAFFSSLIFQLEPAKLEALEKKLKAEEEILRYLILIKRERKEMPRVLIRPRRIIREPKPKVELKELEKKLEEILKE